MPLVEVMVIAAMRSYNWIAQKTRQSKAVNGKKLEICNFQEWNTCLFQFQNLMISAIEQQNYSILSWTINECMLQIRNGRKTTHELKHFRLYSSDFTNKIVTFQFLAFLTKFCRQTLTKLAFCCLFWLSISDETKIWRNRFFQSKNSSKWRKKKP